MEEGEWSWGSERGGWSAVSDSSEGDAGLAQRFGEGLDVTVIAVAAAVEDDRLGDADRLGALGQQRAAAREVRCALASWRSSGSYQLTAASVYPAASSMSCAESPLLERNTETRGRSAVPETLARTRRRRLRRRSPLVRHGHDSSPPIRSRTLMPACPPCGPRTRPRSGCPCPCRARAGAACG